LGENPFIVFGDMVFTMFSGHTDLHTHSLTDGQTELQNAFFNGGGWRRHKKKQT